MVAGVSEYSLAGVKRSKRGRWKVLLLLTLTVLVLASFLAAGMIVIFANIISMVGLL